MKGWCRPPHPIGDNNDIQRGPGIGRFENKGPPKDILLRNAVYLLGQLKEDRARGLLERNLTDKSNTRGVREFSAIALGEIRAAESIGVLRDVLLDLEENSFVVSEAFSAIGSIGGEEAKKALIKINTKLQENSDFEDEANYRVRKANDILKQLQKPKQHRALNR